MTANVARYLVTSGLSGLIKGGVVKWDDRPVWYDVYAAFPPKLDPHFDRLPTREDPLPDIFFPEDVVRARFYRDFGSPGVINLADEKRKSPCQQCVTFVEKFYQIADQQQHTNDDEVYRLTVDAMKAEGMKLEVAS